MSNISNKTTSLQKPRLYEKPIINKLTKMTFPLDIIQKKQANMFANNVHLDILVDKNLEDSHVFRLLNLFEYSIGILGCPYGLDSFNFEFKNGNFDECIICGNFIGLKIKPGMCPCNILGEKEAVKQTWIALEEKGFI